MGPGPTRINVGPADGGAAKLLSYKLLQTAQRIEGCPQSGATLSTNDKVPESKVSKSKSSPMAGYRLPSGISEASSPARSKAAVIISGDRNSGNSVIKKGNKSPWQSSSSGSSGSPGPSTRTSLESRGSSCDDFSQHSQLQSLSDKRGSFSAVAGENVSAALGEQAVKLRK